MDYAVNVEGKEFTVDVKKTGTGFTVSLNGAAEDVRITRVDGTGLALIVNDKPYTVFIESERRIFVNGMSYDIDTTAGRSSRPTMPQTAASQKTESVVKAVMPGLIVQVNVKEGDQVKAGDSLLVIEAMKMQNEVTARNEGRIRSIHVKPGQPVATGDALITLE